LVVLPPILVWADQRNWVSRGLVKQTPRPYETIDERYPPLVDSNGNVDGHVDGGPPAPPAPEPQPVSPGLHVPPAPVPAALWLPQFGDVNRN